MVRVYVAGKLNDMACDYIQNLHHMISVCVKLKKEGYSVFDPGIDVLEGLFAGDFTYEDYFKSNLEWIEVSDCVYVIERKKEESKGVEKEIEFATKCRVPVFYNLVDLDAFKRVKEELRR